ncbi:MAG: hypothetical protein ACRCZF_10725, partial [Gemmataceae bacterium]
VSQRLLEARRAEELKRQITTEDRIELHALDAGGLSGNYTYCEFQNGQQVTCATLYKADDLQLLLKRAMADPKAPKKLKLIAGMNGRKMEGTEWLLVLELVKVLKKVGIQEVCFQGDLPTRITYSTEGTHELNSSTGASVDKNQVVKILSQETKYQDGTQALELKKYFTDEYMDSYFATYAKKTTRGSLRDSGGRIKLSITSSDALKIGDLVPVYRRVRQFADSKEEKIVTHLKVVEISDKTAWFVDTNPPHLQWDYIHGSDTFGSPISPKQNTK